MRNPAPENPKPPATTLPPLRLVVVGPVTTGRYARRVLEPGRLLLGRAADNDVVLDHPSVSARHARIDIEPDGTYLTDLGSTNGSTLNGRRVTGSVELRAQDEVHLGHCELRIEDFERGDLAPARSSSTEPPRASASFVEDGAWIPARHPRRLLVSYDESDVDIAERILVRLTNIGHTVVVGRSTTTDRWGGRLLDAMWSADALIFVVSSAAANSDRIHREVHLAGAEHTTVVPVRIDDVVLPADLAYYERQVSSVDFRRDPGAGLAELQRRLDHIGAKHIARPARLIGQVVLTALLVAALSPIILVILR